MTPVPTLDRPLARTTLLVDPLLPAPLAAAVDEARPFGVLAPACRDRDALVEAAGPGAVAVLLDPHPALVSLLAGWGARVVAVAAESGGPGWVGEVLDARATSVLVRPRPADVRDAVRRLVER